MPCLPASIRRLAGMTGALLAALALLASTGRAETTSRWHDGYNSRVRMVAAGEAGKPVAGVEIELAPGWKTYWRHPGDGGGVPPAFDWTKSDNLQAAKVLYPAPRRLPDPAGDAIGYTDRVIFPVRLVAADVGRPLKLALQLEYGICKDICVPVEATLELVLPPAFAAPIPAALADALDRVPRAATARRPSDPRWLGGEARLDGDAPRLVIDAEFPGSPQTADVFIEVPDGIYVPQPMALGDGQGSRRSFVVDLRTGVEPADLKGKRLKVTLVSESGQSQLEWQLD